LHRSPAEICTACSASCKRVRSLLRSALPDCEKHQQAPKGRRTETVSGGVRLSEKTREASRWVWMFVESRRALVTPTCTVLDKEARSNSVGFDPLGLTQLGSSHTPAPSEQTHPQNSRCTPRCPTVVLWTPCSGVEWRVFEPTIRVWKRHDRQAACEPGGGGCRGVHVHPARLHSHRTPRPSALDHLDLNPTSDLLSHCHRRACAIRCALAER
jgi:hypothetical protein